MNVDWKRPTLVWCSILLVPLALVACNDSPSSSGTTGPAAEASTVAATWSMMSTRNPSTSSNELKAILALGSDNLWAVGSRGASTGSATLIEHYAAGQWQVVTSPNPGAPSQCGSGNVLNGVAGAAPSDIWAVGFYYSCSLFKPFLAHWNGTAWSTVNGPVPSSDGFNQLNGVAARAANDVWAVGTYDAPNGAVSPFTEHWNGASWTRVPAALAAPNNNTLNAVAFVSGSDVWAVGTYLNSSNGLFFTLTEHWNGSTWSVVTSPSPGSYFANVLTGVAAVGPNDVWAVGYYDANGGGRETLVLHWDGASWRLVPSPNTAIGYGNANVLNGVVQLSGNDVWAVGHFNNGSTGNQQRTMTAHWDGTIWSMVASPSPGVAANLSGVATFGGAVWAAGLASPYGNDYQGFFTVPRTLVLQR